jgi:sorbitol/mannitol transport system substrate-binding protein
VHRHARPAISVAMATGLVVGLSGCAGWGGGPAGGGPDTINVLMVNNPQMIDLQQLTEEHFTAETGITVNFTVLPENDVRDKISQEFSSQAGQYDVATLSNFEIPIYARSEWIAPLDDFVQADSQFDQGDVLAPLTASLSGDDGKLYGEPFYGESSFLMYRKDVLQAAGIQMPDKPTWQQVADIAAAVDGAQPGMAGICLRGQPGWGQVFAPLTTVVNTFGGTWFSKNWDAGVDSTSAAGSLEAADSPVKGKIGYAAAPVVKTDSSGWLYAWSWSIQQASHKQDAAWKFISWASSKEYEQLVGDELGWSRVPAGKRTSTYSNPEYLADASAFAQPTLAAIESADPNDPGTQPRPAPGIQFIDIPEFPDLGTQVSQDVSSAIAGRMTVDQALKRGQQLAEDVAARYRDRASK